MAASLDIKERERQIRRYVERMPSLSTTVTKVLEVCNSPNTSANDLNRVISLDPVLTGRVMKLINSAYYSLPNRIASLTMAIIMLGLNTVKNLALSTAVLDVFGRKDSVEVIPADEFWTHSICTGVTAKLIAGIRGIPRAEIEEYFVAGLLHDIGKMPLSRIFPDEYKMILDTTQNDQMSIDRAEETVFGMEHAVVGGMIAKKWRLGRAMTDSVVFHHRPDEVDEESRQLVHTVALANIMANNYGAGLSRDTSPHMSEADILMGRLSLNAHDLSDLRNTVFDEIEKAKVFLEVTRQG